MRPGLPLRRPERVPRGHRGGPAAQGTAGGGGPAGFRGPETGAPATAHLWPTPWPLPWRLGSSRDRSLQGLRPSESLDPRSAESLAAGLNVDDRLGRGGGAVPAIRAERPRRADSKHRGPQGRGSESPHGRRRLRRPHRRPRAPVRRFPSKKSPSESNRFEHGGSRATRNRRRALLRAPRDALANLATAARETGNNVRTRLFSSAAAVDVAPGQAGRRAHPSRPADRGGQAAPSRPGPPCSSPAADPWASGPLPVPGGTRTADCLRARDPRVGVTT